MNGVAGRIGREWRVLRATLRLAVEGVRAGRRPTVEGWLPHIRTAKGSLVIGDRAWFRGIEARVSLSVEPGGSIRIGDRCLLNSGSSITSRVGVRIGDDFRLGAFSSIQDTDSHEVAAGEGVRTAPVVIGDDVWVGRNVVVLAGVEIGDGAVVAAGAVVTRSVAPWTLVAGVPARPVRRLEPTSNRRL